MDIEKEQPIKTGIKELDDLIWDAWAACSHCNELRGGNLNYAAMRRESYIKLRKELRREAKKRCQTNNAEEKHRSKGASLPKL